MRKTVRFLVLSTIAVWAGVAGAQSFWSYDDANNESQIPAECDGVFDDSRGGVFVPTPEEMAQRGEDFLINANPVERSKAGYCLIAAAVQGYVPAQFRVAQLYNKGIILPQDDLSAYRWAFLASLNGSADASRLALLLERFLTTQEIELATASVESMLPSITARYQAELEAQTAKNEEKKEQLAEINREIDLALGIKPLDPPKEESDEVKEEVKKQAKKAVPKGNIFSDNDRLKVMNQMMLSMSAYAFTGESLANTKLQRDTMLGMGGIKMVLSAQGKTCTPRLIHSEVTEQLQDVKMENNVPVAGHWAEKWTVQCQDEQIEIPVRFVLDPTGASYILNVK